MKLVNSQNVNSVDDETGRTALHFAANYDLGDVVELLLKNGANVNAVDNDLNTPLHYAAKHGIHHDFSLSTTKLSANHFDWNLGYEAIVNELVDNWANVNLPNADGETALHFAAIGGKSTRFNNISI